MDPAPPPADDTIRGEDREQQAGTESDRHLVLAAQGAAAESSAMTDKERATLIWNEYKEQNDWQRHNEVQRAALSTILLGISAALLAFHQKGHSGWPVPAFLVVIGVFGVAGVMKYWERFRFHLHQGRGYRLLLDAYYPAGDPGLAAKGQRLLLQTREAAKADHAGEWIGVRRWFLDYRMMQHWLWIGVFLFVAVIGSVLLFNPGTDQPPERTAAGSVFMGPVMTTGTAPSAK